MNFLVTDQIGPDASFGPTVIENDRLWLSIPSETVSVTLITPTIPFGGLIVNVEPEMDAETGIEVSGVAS